MAVPKKMFMFCLLTFLWVGVLTSDSDDSDTFVFDAGVKSQIKMGQAKPMRYILYDVNPGEGFNLRRDVYMRVANLVKFLNRVEPWTLVLPPWGRLYHWRSPVEQDAVPWSTFFDLESLSKHVPVMDFEEYLKLPGTSSIDQIYYLQKYAEGWNNGKWEEKYDHRPCISKTGFKQDSSGEWRWHFWGYSVTGAEFSCISVQSQATNLVDLLVKNTTARSVFLVRAEELIHGEYSEWSKLFWTARRSLVFAKHLRDIADDFRRTELQSTDEADKTVLKPDWTLNKRPHGTSVGGPYVAVHLRRRDFLYGHRDDVPSITTAAEQIAMVTDRLGLGDVFVATDAPDDEFEDLRAQLSKYRVHRYIPTDEILHTYKDGGVAIIDQWICAHARYFMGTSVSTFTFRIHEEREILGFDPDMTFNRFCGDGKSECEQPTKWIVKYD